MIKTPDSGLRGELILMAYAQSAGGGRFLVADWPSGPFTATAADDRGASYQVRWRGEMAPRELELHLWIRDNDSHWHTTRLDGLSPWGDHGTNPWTDTRMVTLWPRIIPPLDPGTAGSRSPQPGNRLTPGPPWHSARSDHHPSSRQRCLLHAASRPDGPTTPAGGVDGNGPTAYVSRKSTHALVPMSGRRFLV